MTRSAPLPVPTRRLVLAAITLVSVAVVGCGDEGYAVTELALERDGWEAVRAEARFARGTAAGASRAVDPDTVYAYLFDSRYDTLYTGPPGRIDVPDRRLGDEEALLVEVCGIVAGQTLCRQRGFTASPKRVRARAEIDYPEHEDTGRARYRVEAHVERRRFDGAGWERVEAPLALSARAYVEGREGYAVEGPLRAGEGTLRLDERPGYDDFAFALNSRLYDARRADVVFEVVADLGGRPDSVGRVVRTVREKPFEERRGDVAVLARRAAGHLLARLGEGRRPRASLYIDDWRFNTVTDRYTVTMELVWEEGGFFGRRRSLTGTLTMHAGGRDATFAPTGGDRHGRARWQERVGTDELRLPDLTPSDDGATAGRQRDRPGAQSGG